MKTRLLVAVISLTLMMLTGLPGGGLAEAASDYDIPNGHFYTQGSGNPSGGVGFRITDEGGIPFWDQFRRLGGPAVLGYPISQRFVLNGFVHQATQKAILQWRPDSNQVAFLNVFDLLHDADKDDSLLAQRSTPRPADFSAMERAAAFSQIVADRLSLLRANPAIQAQYYAISSGIDPMLIYGLPTSAVEDMGDHYAIRLQRAVIQQWKVNTPWAAAGQTTVANGGEIAKEFGLIPRAALIPLSSESLDTVDVPAPADGIEDLADSLKPSVVRVVVPGEGFGSGIVFDSNGLILTNHHVVGRARDVIVETYDGRKLSGRVVGVDPLIDVAVVRANATGLRALPLGDSETVREGDDVLAIGYTPSVANPPSARVGKVLDMVRNSPPIDGVNSAAIESDVFLHPGDSGGPLLNARGEVVGVNTSIVFQPGDDTVVTSQSLAINLAKMAIQQILANQRASAPSAEWLGHWLLTETLPFAGSYAAGA